MRMTPLTAGVMFVMAGASGLALGRVCMGGPKLLGDGIHDPKAAPRVVAPRGELDPEEKRTVEIFKNVAPSVVFITKFGVKIDFFTRNPFKVPEESGSGFIWSEDGYIVTNRHVVGNITPGSEWKVTLADHEKTFDARVVGIAPEKDLAVLKIDSPEKLSPIPVGTSEDLLVGQKVYAIGNPFGLDQSLTKGIISAINREIESQIPGRLIRDVIQTDAAINPGNSGGPLLDSAGRLIGVNTAIKTTSGSSAGIGFAVPVDTVNAIVPQLIKHGYVIRPGLGILPADELKARRFLNITNGVLVAEVTPGSGADEAGLQSAEVVETRRGFKLRRGDVIVGIGGKPVTTHNDMFNILEKYKSGDVVKVSILRDGDQRIEKEIQLRELKQN